MQGRAGKPGPAGPAGQKVRIYYHLPMIFETVCIRVKMELQEQWVLQEPLGHQDQW